MDDRMQAPQRDAEIYEALRHAERLGLRHDEVMLLAWAAGLGSYFNQRKDSNAIQR